MVEYEAVIGLEIHCQLSTKTKLFCGCSTQFGEGINENICPVCTGQPGALPVLNKKAVEYALKAGLAFKCDVVDRNYFERKNYFYPDLPKGYQISQLEKPIVFNGYVSISPESGEKKVALTRIQIEEDAGKLVHIGAERIHGSEGSQVNLNRACTPLIEIVSEPDMRTAEEARLYAEKVRSIVRYLGICDGNMEEGSMRVDSNVSIRVKGSKEYGTRAEIKNVNSFKSIERSINAEISRQVFAVENGERIAQETRHFDENTGKTHTLRSKENSHDYRYFPEPDLVPIVISKEWLAELKDQMPRLPEERKKQYVEEYGLSEYDADILLIEKENSDFFEAVVAKGAEPKKVCNWLMGDISGYLNNNSISISESKITAELLNDLIKVIDDGVVSGKIAKKVLAIMLDTGESPFVIIEAQGLKQMDDSDELKAMIEKIVLDNPKTVEQYKSGNQKVLGFFVGQVMKQTQGKANPGTVNKILKELL